MEQSKAKAIISEINRRARLPSLDLVDRTFPKQASFIEDKARLKAALCTRRAGKSNAASRGLLKAAISHPGSASLYIGLTRDACERILWEGSLKPLNEQFKIGGIPNETKLSMRLPNNSRIYLLGADAKPSEMKKFLGVGYKRVIIDEAASFRINMETLVYEILKPAVADYLGDIWLIGTPDDLTKGLFYEVTTNNRPDWSVHKWTTFENPHMVRQWTQEIAELKASNPRIIETPAFKRMYLGQWAIDLSALVYKFSRECNLVKKVPEDLVYVLGVDLGFDDASAFVVCGYAPHDKNLYIVETYKKEEMLLSDVAERIRYYEKRYNPYRIVVDNASKQAVEELKQRQHLPLVGANKQGKAEFIEIMNSEYILGKIKLWMPACEPLASEYASLIWDERSTKRQEHPSCENHLADAALYAWRHCYQYLAQPAARKNVTQEEVIDLWLEKESQKVLSNQTKEFWERDFDDVG